MEFAFASSEDQDQVKQLLKASGFEHRDISASQLQHSLKAFARNRRCACKSISDLAAEPYRVAAFRVVV